MKTLDQMTEAEMVSEVEASPDLTDGEICEFDRQICLNAYIRGWTGDPRVQPVRTVLAILRQVLQQRILPETAVPRHEHE